jgi:hypothetical protein
LDRRVGALLTSSSRRSWSDPDYFISHVDITRIPQYRQEATWAAQHLDIARRAFGFNWKSRPRSKNTIAQHARFGLNDRARLDVPSAPEAAEDPLRYYVGITE